VDRIDLLIPFSPGALRHVQKRISPKTTLLGEKKVYGNEYQGERAIDVRFSEIAFETRPDYLPTGKRGLRGTFRPKGCSILDPMICLLI
jgi:hypothetical protein